MYDTISGMTSVVLEFLVIVWSWMTSPIFPESLLEPLYASLPEWLLSVISPLLTATGFELIFSMFAYMLVLRLLALIWNAIPFT